jgi:hypothetical protein
MCPIFAAIEKHRAAYAAFCAACAELTGDADDTEIEDLEALLQTRPTTLAGCAAVLRYIDEYAAAGDMIPTLGEFIDLDGADDFLTLIATAIEGLAVQS